MSEMQEVVLDEGPALEPIEQIGTPKGPQKQRKQLKVNRKKVFYICLMIFPLLQFAIFYVGVNFQSIMLAFQKYENSQFSFLGKDFFANFTRVFKEFTQYKTLLTALGNSLIMWVCTAVFGTGVAIFFSYYIFKRKKTGRFFRFVLFLPAILPSILLATVFKLFTSDVLPVAFGVDKVLESTNTSVRLAAVIGYSVFISFGTQVLLYSNAMDQISPSVLEAAQLDGAKPMTEFFRIILPEVMPTVSTFLIASIAGMFMNQANLYNMYGERANSKNFTLGYYMFIMVQNNSAIGYGKLYYPFASALGLCCTVIAIPLTVLFRKFSKRFED